MSIFTPLIIIFILLLNYYLYKRNSYSKSFFLLSSSFLIIYILFAIIIYYNNLSNGFEHGILFGDVANMEILVLGYIKNCLYMSLRILMVMLVMEIIIYL